MSEGNPIPLGSICHIEVPAPDLGQAQAFYGQMFGWTFQPMSDEYVIFEAGDNGGGLDANAPVAENGPVLFMTVEDIPAKLAEIEGAGGTQLTPRTEIGGGHGAFAYFRDPAGNKMGIWSKD